MMKVYVAELELHGVLLFTTEQRPSLASEGGAMMTTGHYIHNYPLIYGFANRAIESYAVIPSLHFLSYRDLEKSKFKPKLAKEPLHYGFVEEQIKKLLEGREAIYAYPAFPVKITPKKFFMQAKGYGYVEFRGALKTVYPRLEHYIALVPPTKFKTIIVTSNIVLPRTLYIRIGMKRMGLFKVYLREAEIHEQTTKYPWTSIPVNLHDTELFGYEIMDAMKVLETRSKPLKKPLASIIGYVRTTKLYLVKAGKEEYRIPLPARLVGEKK